MASIGARDENIISERSSNLKVLAARLARHTPDTVLRVHRGACQSLDRRMKLSMMQHLNEERARLASLVRAFEALGPQQTLERGYAIISRLESGEIVRDAGAIHAGERIQARLKSGSIVAKVEKTRD